MTIAALAPLPDARPTPARREALLRDIRDTDFSLAVLSALHGYTEGTIRTFARQARLSLRGRCGRPYERQRRGDKRAIVERYRGGETLRTIAQSLNPPISCERVRQIIARWEEENEERLPRNNAVAPRTRWRCEVCGRLESRTPFDAAQRHPSRCANCRAIDVATIRGWIEDRRRGVNFHRIGLNAGYSANETFCVAGQIHHYLVVTGQTATIAELWPRGVSQSQRRRNRAALLRVAP